MPKSCNNCARATYRVRGWWTDSETQFVCTGCNIEEENCECPKPKVELVEEPPRPKNYAPGFPIHDDEERPPRE